MTSYFQDGGHDVILQKASSPPRVTSLACSMHNSTWSIQYSRTCWLTHKLPASPITLTNSRILYKLQRISQQTVLAEFNKTAELSQRRPHDAPNIW